MVKTMANKSGYHPHKRPHKGCIGWVYCKRTDKTMDIGKDATIPGKKGYLCECEYWTRLDPFNHTVKYYDDEIRGIDYEAKLDEEIASTCTADLPTKHVRIMYWTEQMSKEEYKEVDIKTFIEVDKIGIQNGWYAWSVFKGDKNIHNGGKKE